MKEARRFFVIHAADRHPAAGLEAERPSPSRTALQYIALINCRLQTMRPTRYLNDRWVKFLSKSHTFWGSVPIGAEPKVGMNLKTGKPINRKLAKSLKATGKPRSTTGFLLDQQSQTIGSFLPPSLDHRPPAVYAIGLNYKAHAIETGKELPRFPIAVALATTSVVGHESPIVVPRCAQDPLEIDYEVELGIVISKPCKNVRVDKAMEYVLGFTVANDVSARRWQGKKGGGQWSRAKSYDTFTPLGPSILMYDNDSIRLDENNALHLNIQTKVNGVVKQTSNTNDMIYTVPEIVSFLSQGCTLEKGTVIITGTPSGVGYTRTPPEYLKHGDVVECSIEHVGTLRNVVHFEGVPVGVEGGGKESGVKDAVKEKTKERTV